MSKFEYSYTYSEIMDVWQLVKDSFKGQISSISIDLWFSPITLESYDDETHTLVMSIESKVKHDIISRSYMDHIRSKFCELLDGEIFIEFICTGEEVKAEQFFDVLGLKRENGRIVVDPDRAHTRAPGQSDNAPVKDAEVPSAPSAAPKAEDIERRPGKVTIETTREGVTVITQHDPVNVPSVLSQLYDVQDMPEPFYVSENGSFAVSLVPRESPEDHLVVTTTEEEAEIFHGESFESELPPFNGQYTFDNFIVGNSNKFAHAACVAVAEQPAKNYNPLFIYGPSGLGKTHLLYAINNYIQTKNPGVKIIYIKGEDFTNHMIDCLSRQAMKEFRDRYRKCDVLLIDDIQFIAGKVATQEEFFHTFNSLYDAHKQVILTSDRPPREIQQLEDRLKTRFEWGLIADIQPPDLELRVAILKQKTQAMDLEISDEILTYMGENLRSNIRQIEGAVKKLGALSFLSGKIITRELAARCVSELLGDEEPITVTIDKVFSLVFKRYDVSKEELVGTKRNKNIAQARHIAIYLIRTLTDMSLPAIGNIFNRDHTTVMSSLNAITKRIESDHVFALEMEEIVKDLKG